MRGEGKESFKIHVLFFIPSDIQIDVSTSSYETSYQLTQIISISGSAERRGKGGFMKCLMDRNLVIGLNSFHDIFITLANKFPMLKFFSE